MRTPNVCVVTLDAVRAENLSAYGYDRPTTPAIEALATESIRFERATAPASVTLDSVASVFSGLYPAEHDAGRSGRLSVDSPLLPELFAGAGYRTGAFTANPFVSPGFGFERGVDTFASIQTPFPSGMNIRRFFNRTEELSVPRRYLEFLREALGPSFLASVGNALQFRFDILSRSDMGGKRTTAAVEQFVDGDAPWFCYAHYNEAHMKHGERTMYRVPDRDRFRFVERVPDGLGMGDLDYTPAQHEAHVAVYDGTLRYLDRQVERLVDRLKATGQWDDTLFVLTADHAECLGEGGRYGHATLTEPCLHVPLLVKPPAAWDRPPGVVEERVSTLGLYATLAAIVGPVPEHASVRGVFEQADAPGPVLGQERSTLWSWSRFADDDIPGGNALYDGDLKLVQHGTDRQLYDLATDPRETEDLAGDDERTERMAAQLRAVLGELEPGTGGEQRTLDTGTQERLEDLGYL